MEFHPDGVVRIEDRLGEPFLVAFLDLVEGELQAGLIVVITIQRSRKVGSDRRDTGVDIGESLDDPGVVVTIGVVVEDVPVEVTDLPGGAHGEKICVEDKEAVVGTFHNRSGATGAKIGFGESNLLLFSGRREGVAGDPTAFEMLGQTLFDQRLQDLGDGRRLEPDDRPDGGWLRETLELASVQNQEALVRGVRHGRRAYPAPPESTEPAPGNFSAMNASVQIGADGTPRCWWCGTDPEYVRYHDEEWGRPLHGEAKVLEKLCLEGAQAGLSWITILRKRPRYREVFQDFDPYVVARFDDDDVERLMLDAGIVRNRGKITATIDNARATVRLLENGDSLDALCWSFAPPPRIHRRSANDPLLATTDESVAMSKELKRRGFRFVGPTTMYAFMQSSGMVDDHIDGCWVSR
jgi:DNA-3-methyladenine glycosylase I